MELGLGGKTDCGGSKHRMGHLGSKELCCKASKILEKEAI
jgi:hypothetical protein